ncbi:NAD(P)H-dependent oxidoreductase [Paludibacterium yongneupense]|uniref:NAD(P)H-dependent oxidoreductase n=1 Tax=Paludibacterium yongneupense TaxID=400061 RepID=UPI00040DFFFA|nr:NAD(P)H-dependent oxidoreductase [Paludibacterium yongneupense]
MKKKTVLIVHAQPEPSSLTCQFQALAMQVLRERGHEVIVSDLYGMRWKAVYDELDFPHRVDSRRLSFVEESGQAYASGRQTADVAHEQQKLLAADAVIVMFPLWWFGMPAILKGWVDRVFAYGFAYGYRREGNRYRYGDGILKGKRALLSVMVGGPAADYSPRGINGPLDQLLFPVMHGTFFFAGMDMLPVHAVYGTGRLTAAGVEEAKSVWRSRVERLFDDEPIPFRRQNGGDYPDLHTLAAAVAPGQTGLMVHVATEAVALAPDGVHRLPDTEQPEGL